MKTYGHSDDASREFVITEPATPWPWINYLGTEDFFGLISNTAGGYCFCKDAKFRRITRYRYNGVPMDAGGRYFYINDGGRIWSPGWKPCKTPLDFYECRHGMGYTRITGELGGLRASALFFVPLGRRCEVHRLTLANTGSEPKAFKLFSFVEWCLWNAETDMENFQRNFSTGEVEVDGSVIYHKTEYRERRDHYAFYGVNSPISGFDTDRESFLGLYNGFDAPQRVLEGSPGGSVAHGWSPTASSSPSLPASLATWSSCSATSRTRTMRSSAPSSLRRPTAAPLRWRSPEPAKSSPPSTLRRKSMRPSPNLAPTGTGCSASSRSAAECPSWTGWSTSGTSTSAWSRSISRAALRSLRAA